MTVDAPGALEQLAGWIRECRQCPLHQSRRNAVPGEGDPGAVVMLVGEAPGAKEDRQGRPFVGAAGRFLDDLLERTGMDRSDLFITSVAKCRPPENRNPRRAEADTCVGMWLWRQVALVEPDVVVVMGKVAARAVLEETGNLEDLHGQVRQTQRGRFMLTYHPAAAMRFPVPEAGLREDFAKLREMI